MCGTHAHGFTPNTGYLKKCRLLFNGFKALKSSLHIRELPDGESQLFEYDTENQLIRAKLYKPDGEVQQWQYAYDPFGRRISKERIDKGSLHSTDPKRTVFIWDGSRIVQEYNYKGVYTYFYTDQDSYEPLAHVFYNNKDEKLYLSYYHTDQIGIPREQTDQFGNLLWAGEYDAWGKLTAENKIYPNAHQPFRLQNQYFDAETGLHYNLMRYYDPNCGRFVNQDPIGLLGGEHLYSFAPNSQMWVDPLGWKKGNGSQTLGKAMITNGRVPNVKNFVRSDWQAHHLIPEEIWDRYANFLNKELGLTRRNGKNGYQNGIFLPNSEAIASNAKCKYFHRGSHDTYSRRVRRKLARIRRQYRKDGDKDKARDAIRDLQQNLFNELNQTGMNPIRLS